LLLNFGQVAYQQIFIEVILNLIEQIKSSFSMWETRVGYLFYGCSNHISESQPKKR
jgi:hypothetical protein